MKNKLFICIFSLVLFIGVFLRLYHLGSTPPSLNWDEVSLGYNAWSILTTGKDEYGKSFPLILRSYDDYKPGLYSYFLIPIIALTGLSEVAVRLPSALFGIIGMIIVYLLVKEIFENKKITFASTEIDTRIIGLVSMGIFAISPWDIQFSRIAFESQVGMVLNLCSLLFFLKGMKKGIFLPLSFMFAGLSIHMYQSEKVFVPILLLFVTVLHFKKVWQVKKYYIFGACIALLIALPLALNILFDSNVLLRAKGVSVFSDQTGLLARSSEKLIQDHNAGYALGLLMDNRRVEFVRQVIAGYMAHFDFNWLFISGDIARHHAPFMGLLYIWQIPFLLIGVYLLFFLQVKRRIKILLIGYLLIVPIPASITSGVPHAVRTMNFLGILDIVIALGLVQSYVFLIKQKNSIKFASIAVFFVILLFNFVYYLNQYFVQLNYYDSKEWLYGYKQTVEYVQPIHRKYRNVIVANNQPLDQSHMFFLFYTQYPPEKYLREGGTVSGGFREKHNAFSNYIFRPIDWNREQTGNLLVGRPSDIPENAKILKRIYYLNGELAIVIAEK